MFLVFLIRKICQEQILIVFLVGWFVSSRGVYFIFIFESFFFLDIRFFIVSTLNMSFCCLLTFIVFDGNLAANLVRNRWILKATVFLGTMF